MTNHTHDHGHHHGHRETPTQVLMAEHELILEALDALEKRAAAIRAGITPDRAYIEKAVIFLREFADKCHHGKEENLLFRWTMTKGKRRPSSRCTGITNSRCGAGDVINAMSSAVSTKSPGAQK